MTRQPADSWLGAIIRPVSAIVLSAVPAAVLTAVLAAVLAGAPGVAFAADLATATPDSSP